MLVTAIVSTTITTEKSGNPFSQSNAVVDEQKGKDKHSTRKCGKHDAQGLFCELLDSSNGNR